MHHKFMVIDQTIVITGSANFTSSGIHGDANEPTRRGNVNHLLRINSTPLANIFREDVQQLWSNGPGATENSHFGRSKSTRGGGCSAQASTTPASRCCSHRRPKIVPNMG